MGGHKVDDIGGNRFCGANKIALVFTILIVYYNNNFTSFYIRDGFFYGV